VDDDLYPISLYLYDKEGRYGKPFTIESEEQLNGFGVRLSVAIAMQEGRKVVMTDPLDRMVFHAEGGAILFPSSLGGMVN
jgi:hypothetical protein